jgi:conjugative relaxase-like TrwC/TraI family protein
MLYINKIKFPLALARYYQDGENIIDNVNTFWFGKYAQIYGLVGEVDKKVLRNLYNEGKLNGKEIIANSSTHTRSQYQNGYELTFVAMKSLSALAIEDERIISAHNQAVAKTLQYIEDKVVARSRKNAITEKYNTQNLLIAGFHHKNSKLNGLNLHTHCLVFNTTLLEGEPLKLELGLFMDLQRDFGMQYRLELVKLLPSLGYSAEFSNKDLFFITTRNAMRTMSKC